MYGIYAKNENKFLGNWELLEQFETKEEAEKELISYYIPENKRADDEEKCEFKVDVVK